MKFPKKANKKAANPDDSAAFFILGMKRKRGDLHLLSIIIRDKPLGKLGILKN